MIEAIELTSRRRSRGPGGAVRDVSFDVYPGQVTALLGALGSGKSAVLRMMAELEPASGRTLFGGRRYRALRPAVREVGLALNPDAMHPGRTVQSHLQLYCAAGGVPKARIAEVLEIAGLSTHAATRCGRLDAGQRQRLAIAAALLGDPSALILDEPRALDAHGTTWFHALIRAYAAQGRTVLVAATDPDSIAGTADHVVILRRDEEDGISRVVASRSAAEVFDERRAIVVQVRSPQAARLAAALEAEGARLAAAGPGAIQVRGLDRARIGEVAHLAGICLHELTEIGHDDDIFGLRPVAPRQKEPLSSPTPAEAEEARPTRWNSGVRLLTDTQPIEVVKDEVPEPTPEPAPIVPAEVGGWTSVTRKPAAQPAATEQAPVVPPHAEAGEPVTVEMPAAVEASPVAVNQTAPAGSVLAAAAQAAAEVGRMEAAAKAAHAQAAATRPAGADYAAVGQAQGSEISFAGAALTGASQASAEVGQGHAAWGVGQAQVGEAGLAGALAAAGQAPVEIGRVDAAAEVGESQVGVAGYVGEMMDQVQVGAMNTAGPGQAAVGKAPAEIGKMDVDEPQGSVAGVAGQVASVAHAGESRIRLAGAVGEVDAGTSQASTAPTPKRGANRAFGAFRWGRGKAADAAVPEVVVEGASGSVGAAQPAVPFTVAEVPGRPVESEGMTPWRAVAARAGQQPHQNQVMDQNQNQFMTKQQNQLLDQDQSRQQNQFLGQQPAHQQNPLLHQDQSQLLNQQQNQFLGQQPEHQQNPLLHQHQNQVLSQQPDQQQGQVLNQNQLLDQQQDLLLDQQQHQNQQHPQPHHSQQHQQHGLVVEAASAEQEASS